MPKNYKELLLEKIGIRLPMGAAVKKTIDPEDVAVGLSGLGVGTAIGVSEYKAHKRKNRKKALRRYLIARKNKNLGLPPRRLDMQKRSSHKELDISNRKKAYQSLMTRFNSLPPQKRRAIAELAKHRQKRISKDGL